MKMPIGDIADRYSICKLKSERLGLDNSKELDELKNELNKYEDIDIYVGKLYEVNGQIWDLESDIRKEKEDELGLEEVGRRAIKIRGFNNIRVSYKNEISSKYNEGFIEVKMNHGSQKEVSLVVTLTTVPERLNLDNSDGLQNVLKHLCEQEDDDYEVHFNIPEFYFVTKEPYIIPDWLNDYKLKYPHLKVFRTEDFGPPTKFVPTLGRITNPETIILVVDDDLLYYPDMIVEHRKYQEQLKDSAICYEGRGCLKPLHNGDIRDHWIICVTEVREVRGLQHYKSVSYKRKCFKEDFYEYYLGKTFSDDILVGRYFVDAGVKIYVVPYEKHNHLFETRELWDTNQGVSTFPIYRCATSVVDTGCNNKKMLALQPKFYDAPDMGKNNSTIHPIINKPPTINFDTDKISHGFIPFYDKYFSKINECKNVLEIGIYDGGSLKWLSSYFPDATIYGFDINKVNDIDSDKIKTFVVNQGDAGQLKSVISEINNEFDVIIDDGSHTMRHQQMTFGELFKSVKSGGYYVIEDLHTSSPNHFPQHKESSDLITTIEMLRTYISDNKVVSNYISDEDKKYIEENVELIEIWSRTNDFAESVTSIIVKK
jgi:hypothetical protein